MKTVWKYPLKPSKDDRAICSLEMPTGAQALHVSAATGEPCLWVLVEDWKPKETRHFIVLGTGHGGPDNLDVKRYVGTFFVPCDVVGMMGGLPATLVFHVFET